MKEATSGFLSRLSAPAQRALTNAGIKTLKQLAKYTEKEILALHGIGPSAIPKLKEELKNIGLTFRD
jgi:DNA-directed RNA polymerase alpha subunit